MKRSLVLLLLVLCAAAASAQPLDVGARKQLFIDQRFIEASDNIALHTHAAQKLGLVIDANNQPIDPQSHISRVIEQDGVIRMYLGADSITLYESDDALHFRRTDVSIPVPARCLFATIFVDTHDQPERRYKVIWIQAFGGKNDPSDGIYIACSADGVHFADPARVLPLVIDNPILAFWDQRIDKYVIYPRALAPNTPNQRRVARIQTDDILAPWPYNADAPLYDPSRPDLHLITPGNVSVVLQADDQDNPLSDIYYNAAFIYPWAQDVYLMFPARFRHYSPSLHPFVRPHEDGKWEDFGLLETQLAVSRDGIHWQWPSREAYVPMGLGDEWDRWYTVTGPGIVRRGDYLYQYYVSSGRSHDSIIPYAQYDQAAAREGGLGIVRQRLDGFVSADADYRGGWLQTPVITFSGNRLRLNIDTGAMGTAFVELRDADNQPIPGYSLTDCEEIGGNYTDKLVIWKGNPDVSALAGKPLRLYFKLTRAQLYAFQFGD